ncbi:MAG: cytochrome ubiquinol oxidase subunit II [Patescibacteria group bacterium]
MKRVVNIAAPILIAVGLVVLFVFLTAGLQIDVLQPSGEVAQAQRDLFIFTTALSLIVVLPVFGLLAYFAIKYRAGNKKATYMPEWGENRWLEALWWGIPIIIIGILGATIYQTSHSLDPYKQLSGGKPLEVQVVALRWKWLFIYPEQQISTLNHLSIPVDRPVRFTMTADAPMSAFWIPALGSQVYAMNGMESQLNLKATKQGSYTGYTTNINGEGYATMTFETNVVSQVDFAAWTNTAATSDKGMNLKEYEMLARPESVTDQRTYKLADAKLFDTIIEKYSHGQSSHAGHEKAAE